MLITGYVSNSEVDYRFVDVCSLLDPRTARFMIQRLAHLFVATCCLWQATATPVGVATVAYLTARADVAVVAKAVDAVWTPKGMSVELEVIRAIKGPLSQRLIRVVYPPDLCTSSPSSRLDSVMGTTGVRFMTGQDDEYSALAQFRGAIPCEALPALLGVTQRELPDGLIAERDTPERKLMAEFVATLRKGSAAEKANLRQLINHGQFAGMAPEAVAMLAHAIASPDATPDDRILAVTLMTWATDGHALEQLASMGDLSSLNESQRTALLSAVRGFRGTQSAQVKALSTLVKSSAPLDFRAAAAESLAANHSTEALPALRNMLDDPELRIRHQGARGIAYFANGEPPEPPDRDPRAQRPPAPSAKYRTVDTVAHQPPGVGFGPIEEYYVPFWRNWFDSQFPRR